MGWRYFTTVLNGDGTEEPGINQLPLTDVSIMDTLNDPNTITASLKPEHSSMASGLTVMGTAVYAELDGVIRGGGILTGKHADGPNLGLSVTGFSAYPGYRTWTAPYYAVAGADPAVLIRKIWSAIQDSPGGNVALRVQPAATNVKVGTKEDPFRLAPWEAPNLAQVLDDLAASAGFDTREVHWWEPDGTIGHRLLFGRPLGTRKHDLRFVIGENTMIPPVSEEASDFASDVLLVGAGEGKTTRTARASTPRGGRLRTDKVITRADLSSQAMLTSTANRLAAMFRPGTDDVQSLVVADTPAAPFGSFAPGDDIHLSGDAMWGGQMDVWLRVLSVTYSPDNSATATLAVAPADKVATQ